MAREHELGGDQELIAALRTRSGEVWGALGLYREPDRPMFDAAEMAFLRAVAPHLADGVRRALLVGEATDPEGPDAPGLVVLDEDWQVESTHARRRALAGRPARRRLGAGPAADRACSRSPAGRCAPRRAGGPGEVAMARVLTRAGTLGRAARRRPGRRPARRASR